MSDPSRALGMRLRIAVVLKHWGQLCRVAAVLWVAPLVVSLRFGETEVALRHALAIGLLAAAGWPAAALKAPPRVRHGEAMAVAALAFVITPLPLTLPLMGAGLSFTDALFEAVSGITTTGLSTLATVEDRSSSFHFQRAFMQWFGGLSIVVLLLATTLRHGPIERGLSLAEQVDQDDLVGGTAAHARRVLVTYGALTALGIGALWLAGASPQDAVLYGLSAISTGGFAPHDDSLLSLGDYPAQVAVTLTCLAGAVSMVTYRRALREGLRSLGSDPQLLALLVLGASLTLLCGLSLYYLDGLPLRQTLRSAPLTALSAQTTSGFSCLPASGLGSATKLLLVASMFVGASLGSSAGGIKLLRLLILVRVVRGALIRVRLPRHAVYHPRVGGHVIDAEQAQAAALITGLFVAVVVLSWGAFVAYGVAPIDGLFEVVSATGTVGLSSGVASSGLPAALKLLLCLDMLMGRLEVVPLLMLVRVLQPGRRKEKEA